MADLNNLLGTRLRFSFTSNAVAAGTFAVVDMRGMEAISTLYRFELLLISEDPHIKLEAMLAATATFTVYPEEASGPPVAYHGALAEFAQLHQAGPYTFYRAILVPRLHWLSLERWSEVYLEKTRPQIIEMVLKKGGFSPADYEFRLIGSFPARPYLCQYEEAPLTYINRLMEWRGLYYFFEQGSDREKLIVVDSKSLHTVCRSPLEYWAAGQGHEAPLGVVHKLTCIQKPVPRKVGLKEYEYSSAPRVLTAEAEVAPEGRGEAWFFGEHHLTQKRVEMIAHVRAEELSCRAKVFQGESTAIGLRAGYLIELKGHYRDDFNRRFLAIEVQHEGSQAGMLLTGLEGAPRDNARGQDYYRNRFTLIPGEAQFRPAQVTPRPKIDGGLNAFVDAEGSGQYAEIDEEGRYKVQLPFDRLDKPAGKASAWIRMLSPYCGDEHGMHFPLHKGTEVLLAFENGDPDRPVILGAVSNTTTPNLVTRNNQTQSVIHTAGGNIIRMEDLAGSEYAHLGTPFGNTWVRMGSGTASGSTVGAQAASDGDGFTFQTDKDWTVQATDGSTTLQQDTLSVSGSLTETLGTRATTVGKPIDILKYAGQYIPGVGTIVGLAQGYVASRTVYGSDSDSVYGKKSETVVGVYSETHVGLSSAMYLGARSQVGVTEVQTWGEYIQGLGQKIQTAGTYLKTAGSYIKAAGQRVVAAVQSLRSTQEAVEVTEIELSEIGTKVGSTGVDIEETETEIRSSTTSIEETSTRVQSGAMDIEMCDLKMIQ